MLASENGHIEVVDILILAGAELDLQDVVSSDNVWGMERGEWLYESTAMRLSEHKEVPV